MIEMIPPPIILPPSLLDEAHRLEIEPKEVLKLYELKRKRKKMERISELIQTPWKDFKTSGYFDLRDTVTSDGTVTDKRDVCVRSVILFQHEKSKVRAAVDDSSRVHNGNLYYLRVEI